MGKEFDPMLCKHWPVVDAYREKRISIRQAEAQLKDLGMAEWELRLYLDNDPESEPDE